MLDQIVIDNFATIEHLSFDLGEGLNIITGETGAGKSVLVEAISTALGGRADISMVRTGASKARIQIAGSVKDEPVILTRELMASGKSISKINGEMVSLTQLRTFCRTFVDIHGQYDNQQIRDPQNHLAITDQYHPERITGELHQLQEFYHTYSEKKKSYDTLRSEEAEALRQQDFYRYESEYIAALHLIPGEDEALRDQLEFMKNSGKIFSAVNGAYERIYEMDASVLSNLRTAVDYLEQISSLSKDVQTAAQTLDESYYNIEDVSDTLRSLRDSLNYDDDDLDRISERLSALEDAKRKYRMNLDEIIAYGKELSAKLSLIDNYDAALDTRKEEMNQAYAALRKQADLVSRIRKENAKELSSAMEKELQDLAFAQSRFEARVTKLPEIGFTGQDAVEFLISTNPGEPLRPLARIASGGEISRIMLAFKHIIGDNDQVETMIFDEIDTGISGRTALIVGKKMQEISSHHQVLCVTHLPQIAAYGRDNFQIRKETTEDTTRTTIEPLDADGKLHMLAGMISGDPDSSSALDAARELEHAAAGNEKR